LRPEADAEHGLVSVAEGTDQRRSPAATGLCVVERTLLATEDHQTIVAGMVVRYGYAAPGKTQIDIGAGFGQGWRNETERSPDVVFDDKNAQAVPPPRHPRCRNSG
jgi:hypothetical protein